MGCAVHIQVNMPEHMDKTIHVWLNIQENYQTFENPEWCQEIEDIKLPYLQFPCAEILKHGKINIYAKSFEKK